MGVGGSGRSRFPGFRDLSYCTHHLIGYSLVTRYSSDVSTAAQGQAGGSGDGGQRAKWVRLTMLLRLRERFSCWAGFRLVLTRKGIDAMYKAYKEAPVMTKQKLAQTRTGDWGAGADGIGRRGNAGKRHEEGGDHDRLWRTRRQTTQGRRRGGGANAQGETREGAGLCGDQ